MRLLRRGMPKSQVDATVEVGGDPASNLVTTEQFEATLYRALVIQAVVTIVTMTAINAAIMAAIMTALLTVFK